MLEAIKGKHLTVSSVDKNNNSLILDTEKGKIKLTPYADGIIRIVYTLSEKFSRIQSPGTIAKSESCPWSFAETETSITIKTERIRLVISKENCSFSYYDNSGKLLTKEPERGGKTVISYKAYKAVRDENSLVEKIETPDGVKEVLLDSKKEFYKDLYHTRLEFEWDDEEALYGLGQQEEGSLNLRGTRQYIHQANMKIAMPFLLSTRGYGILLDTYSPSIFNDNEYGSYLYNESAVELDYYFIQGDCFDEIIGGYREVTGRASMLAKWAFGYMQSQERYESQKEIISTVKEYRRRKVPLDSIVLDWKSWEEGKWGQKTFDNERFPDPGTMTEILHKNGAHLMISIWPNMHESTENYNEMKEKNGLFPHSEIYNAFDPKARFLYWNQTNAGLFNKGVDAWWCDSSEPVTPEWNSPDKPEPDQNYVSFHETAKNYMDEEYTNAYPLMHAKTMYEGQRSVSTDKRVVNLTRSGYTGQQRYGTILWSGDISANWQTLKKQIPAGLNLCASGFPYWTLDIGAFFVKKGDMWFWNGDYEKGCKDLGYRELYTRWLQLGTFLPIFRSHGTDTRREIWNFGEKGEIFYDTIAKFIDLRYRLLPYIYSMAGMVTQKNYTMMRLLAFDFLHDQNVFNIKNQYMFGDALMICPVTEPMYYAGESVPLDGIDKTRNVYLPTDTDWYDFWTDKKYHGGQTISAEAGLDIMPIFVRSGSIIPMAAVAQHSGISSENSLNLIIYPGSNGMFTIYQDEQNNYNYEKGDFAAVDLEWNDDGKKLTIGKRNGSFKGMEEVINFTVSVIGEAQKLVKYDGSEISYDI
jgi:alpha-D-xyloside xylohydrolase